MAMEVPFTEAQFSDKRREDLFETSFQAAMTHFKRKMERLVETAYPVIKRVYEEQGEIYENILVPITDGKHVFNIRTNLKEAYDTQAQAVVREFEKNILLHNIDDAWKENLRELDELKKSVQNASYEQKDPLLIFKLESAKIFETMVNKINNSTISTLLRGQIYAPEQTTQVREAAPVQAPKQQYTESKENLDEDRSEMAKAAARDTREQVTQPIIKSKQPGRNDPCPCGSGKKFKNCHGRGLV
jgi:preprotein translocase subunit SecA